MDNNRIAPPTKIQIMASTMSSGRPVDTGKPSAVQDAAAVDLDITQLPRLPVLDEVENIPADLLARLCRKLPQGPRIWHDVIYEYIGR